MLPTHVLTLLETKQVWELSDKDIVAVKSAILKLNHKLHNEQQLRFMAEEAKRSDYMPVA